MNIESDSKCLDDIDNDNSIVMDILHVLYVCLENLLCVLFQFFQMYFGFNALFHEQAFQLIAIVVFDLGWALYGIGQALTMKYFRDKINKISSCRQVYPYDLTFRYFDIPYTVIYFVLALLSAFISFKLYQQLSWNIYKKIGADLSMKKLYMKRLVSTTLLKYELYFFLLFLMLNGIRLFGGADDPKLKPYWNYHSIESVLVFFMALLAYQSIRLEWKIGMYIFFVLWITYILDAIFVVVASAYVHWYFLTFWALLFIILALATIVYGVLLMKGFGKGLKKFFVKSSAKPTSPGEEEANIETQTEEKSNFNPTKKWTIEDLNY
ncbi:10066_t:CDS:2 [Gigaspora margarita]|uniref:10066_t:CDS:1 n=1 Tax=Gigaspora margarita TaxID=4874 RepID=A0ABN7UPU2_GIGMA|nr:10066_t:CDS:2 [Gigaspora margarita]